jgi:hypothetical protein
MFCSYTRCCLVCSFTLFTLHRIVHTLYVRYAHYIVCALVLSPCPILSLLLVINHSYWRHRDVCVWSKAPNMCGCVGPKGPGLIKKYPAVAVFYEIRGPKGPGLIKKYPAVAGYSWKRALKVLEKRSFVPRNILQKDHLKFKCSCFVFKERNHTIFL